MTKKDLDNLILKQNPELDEDDVKNVTDLIFERIKSNLANGIEVSIPNFGKFKIAEKAARLAKNPKTGETIQVAETRGVRFTNSKTVKEILNEK